MSEFGLVISIEPVHTQVHFELLVRAAASSTNAVSAPGDQGAGMRGMQGIGVKTPMAAAVAAATSGFAGLWHWPKTAMLTIGRRSFTEATGSSAPTALTSGNTVRDAAEVP
jgi:hypothetical protein